MLQRSSRVLALILVLMCSLLGCQASDKNIKTASAVVTNILTVPHAAVEEAISEEADDVNALHEAYHQVMGEYVAKDDDGVFIWWQTLTGYSSSWNFSIEVD